VKLDHEPHAERAGMSGIAQQRKGRVHFLAICRISPGHLPDANAQRGNADSGVAISMAVTATCGSAQGATR